MQEIGLIGKRDKKVWANHCADSAYEGIDELAMYFLR